MKTLLRTLVFACALGFGIWTLAVSFSPIASNFQAGDEVSADIFNTLFNTIGANFDAAKTAIDANETALAALTSQPAVSAGILNNQAIPSGSVRKVNWNAESFDIGEFHDNASNNTRLTVPETGIYQINALIAWETNGSGDRLLSVLKNGTLTQLSDTKTPVTGSSTTQSISGMLELAAGDFIELSVFQSSGSELDLISTIPMQFSMVKVSQLP